MLVTQTCPETKSELFILVCLLRVNRPEPGVSVVAQGPSVTLAQNRARLPLLTLLSTPFLLSCKSRPAKDMYCTVADGHWNLTWAWFTCKGLEN